VLSSGITDHHQRLLTIDERTIQWKMWIDAYLWEQDNHSFKIHHKKCNASGNRAEPYAAKRPKQKS
jgi:hypothetical protein